MDPTVENTCLVILMGEQQVSFDLDDYHKLEKYIPAMFINGDGYVYLSRNRWDLKLHRYLMGAPPGITVDHIDRNKLNNCKSNLRFATPRENAINVGPAKGKVYKGAYYDQRKKRWVASSKKKSKLPCFLGLYDTQEEACIAYNQYVRYIYGDYAWLNPVETPEPSEEQKQRFLKMWNSARVRSEAQSLATLRKGPRKGRTYKGTVQRQQGRWLSKPWEAVAPNINGHGHHRIGYYKTEDEAARAYNYYVLEHYATHEPWLNPV